MPPSALSSDLPKGWPEAQADLLDRLPEAARAMVLRVWPDVSRKLSSHGIDVWLRGADALIQLGRGEAVVLAWVVAMPDLARELGEDILAETAQACLGFASRTSGAVIERILETAPLAARRLGDAGLFRSYLRFLEHVLARAPRAMRPMLGKLAELFDVLTLGGLRRWADWGIEAHRTDYVGLDAYFSLSSDASKAVLQAERKGVLLVDVQRRLGMYLRALWGREFTMVPTAGDFESRSGLRPFVDDHMLHLPDALDDWQGHSGLDLYRAQVAHLAAHLACLTSAIPADGLNALQMQCIGLIEDARAEALAIEKFPNLRSLWLKFHQSTGSGMGAKLDSIARCLLSGTAEDPLTDWLLGRFGQMKLQDSEESRRLGLSLYEHLFNYPYSPHSDSPSCPYRCDNRVLWEFEELDWNTAAGSASVQLRKYVSVSEMVNEVEVETAGEDAQEIWVQAHEFFDDDGTSFNEREGKAPVSPPVSYEEFDSRLQLARPAWATVHEVRAKLGDPAVADQILSDHQRTSERLRRLLEAMRPQGTVRLRKLEDGDDLDLNPAISAAIDTRLGQQPDPRVMMRVMRKTRDTAILVLLDLSESTNDPVGAGQTVLDLTKTACVLLSDAVGRVGDRFAIHGFCSDGRENVFYSRFKDFDQDWGAAAKARLAGAEGRLSTRMGAAVRHATAHLARVSANRKLLLILTDGAPADVDVRDPQYLLQDTRHAVDGAKRQGIVPFCLTLDPRADAYAQRIFGSRNVQVLDRVERLPERLPQLYASLTK